MQKAPAARERSLFVRLVALALALILLPAVLSIAYILTAVSSRLQTSAEESALFYGNQIIERNASDMELLRNSAQYLIGDRDVRAIMSSSEEPLLGTQLWMLQNKMNSAILYNVAWTDQYIDALYLFRDENTALSSTRSGLYALERAQMRSVYRRYRDFSSVKTLVKPDFNSPYAYFIEDYTDISTMQVCGKIIIRLNVDRMVPAEALQRIYPGADVLFSDDADVVLAAQSRDGGPALADELRAFGRGASDSAGYVRWRGQDCYHIRRTLDRTNLKLDLFIPRDEILRTARTTAVWYIAFTAAVLLLTLTGALLLGRRLARPVRRSIRTIEHMRDGDLTVRMAPTDYAETNKLVHAFNNMADHLESLYDDAYTKGMLLRESEFRLLEAQINPHFIFNVLETINLQCMANGQKETSRMVSDLAALLRASLSRSDRQKVTLAEELQYVRCYLDIQQARFHEALRYEIDYADESLLRCYLPKFTLQPLVENSVVHGLENKPGGGTVRIQIWEEDDSVYLRVEDDGVGFLLGELPPNGDAARRHNHVALANIERRLALLYGGAGSLHLNSTPGVGTIALVVIPYDEKEG